MSEDTPEVVLNEFGDLSRRARRELEARGINPETAVTEYKIATSQIPIITEEQAASARHNNEASVVTAEPEAQVTVDPTPAAPVQHSPAPSIPASAMPPSASLLYTPPPMQSAVAPPSAGFPRVDNTVVSANTGPIEPINVEPALDSGSLAAIEQTLAAAADPEPKPVTAPVELAPAVPSTPQQEVIVPNDSEITQDDSSTSAPVEVAAPPVVEDSVNDFDELLGADSELVASDATSAEPSKLSRKDKKALKRQAKDEKAAIAVAAVLASEATTELPEAVVDSPVVVDLPAAEGALVVESAETATIEESDTNGVDEDSVVLEVSESVTVIYEDEADSPQTISEVTAAIAVAEAVAAAEAAVENGEVIMDINASEVPTTTGSIPIISNALILPSLPETTGQITPITQTGELVITGSLLIPPSVSQVGANIDHFDTSEIDIIADDQEIQATSTLAPVSAASAVSAYDIANSVITKPQGMNERLPFILSITAAGLAVGVVALLVVGYITGMF